MKWMKRIAKWILYFLCIPMLYAIISLLTTYITSNELVDEKQSDAYIYLNTNSIHLELSLPIENLTDALIQKIGLKEDKKFMSFGWGDENFYLNTPEWSDLTLSTTVKALFVSSTALMHVSQFSDPKKHWERVPVSTEQLDKLVQFLDESFEQSEDGSYQKLEGKGYWKHDDFFKSTHNYHCFYTCNSWVNESLKKAELPSCLWTPYAFRIVDLYTKEK